MRWWVQIGAKWSSGGFVTVHWKTQYLNTLTPCEPMPCCLPSGVIRWAGWVVGKSLYLNTLRPGLPSAHHMCAPPKCSKSRVASKVHPRLISVTPTDFTGGPALFHSFILIGVFTTPLLLYFLLFSRTTHATLTTNRCPN
jgi:hypothetical protein